MYIFIKIHPILYTKNLPDHPYPWWLVNSNRQPNVPPALRQTHMQVLWRQSRHFWNAYQQPSLELLHQNMKGNCRKQRKQLLFLRRQWYPSVFVCWLQEGLKLIKRKQIIKTTMISLTFLESCWGKWSKWKHTYK